MKSTYVTVSEIVDIIFSTKPQPPYTYTLDLTQFTLNQNITVFQILMNILINGAKKLYGETVSPATISKEQYEMLQEYMQSIGYKIKHNYTYSKNNTPIAVNIWFEYFMPNTSCNGRPIVE